MKKTVLRYGAYSAVTLVILFLFEFFLGKNVSFSTREIFGYINIIVSLSFLFFGIRHYRDHQNNGSISFKKALTIGILISLIVALVFGIIDVVYRYLNPNFVTEYYAYMVEEVRNSVPPEQLQEKLKDLEAQKELFSSSFMSFLVMSMTVFVLGFIISLISALFLQRK